MFSSNVGNVRGYPYITSYTSSVQNRSNEKISKSFSDIMPKSVEGVESKNSTSLKFPGDVTISYPPMINNISNNSFVSEKSNAQMTLDEYKQSVMSKISKFPVSGWVRSTFSSSSIIIKEEAFERMKIDPEYEKYVLNRVRSAYSVKGLPVGSNNVGFDVIGASPEECYGYAGPAGDGIFSSGDDGETWWKKRREKMEKLLDEQLARNYKIKLENSKRIKEEYKNQIYEFHQRSIEMLNKYSFGSFQEDFQL